MVSLSFVIRFVFVAICALLQQVLHQHVQSTVQEAKHTRAATKQCYRSSGVEPKEVKWVKKFWPVEWNGWLRLFRLSQKFRKQRMLRVPTTLTVQCCSNETGPVHQQTLWLKPTNQVRLCLAAAGQLSSFRQVIQAHGEWRDTQHRRVCLEKCPV